MANNPLSLPGDGEVTNEAAIKFLSGLIGKTLRVQLTDRRMFVGNMRCTDKDQNIILSNTQEYREPSQASIIASARIASSSSAGSGSSDGKFTANMSSRYVGLVVCPGHEITKIEVEKFMPSR